MSNEQGQAESSLDPTQGMGALELARYRAAEKARLAAERVAVVPGGDERVPSQRDSVRSEIERARAQRQARVAAARKKLLEVSMEPEPTTGIANSEVSDTAEDAPAKADA